MNPQRCVKPIVTYGAETRADSSRSKNILIATEMNVIRAPTRNTILDEKRVVHLREEDTEIFTLERKSLTIR